MGYTIYCPSRYTKANLINTSHIINEAYFELKDPRGDEPAGDRQCVIDCIPESLGLSGVDVKLYFSQVCMTEGIDVKLLPIRSKLQPGSVFRLASTRIEDLQKLTSQIHQINGINLKF